MAVALDLPPSEVERIAETAPDMLDALRRARANRWTTETELLAGLYELTHANYRLLASIGGARKEDIPKPVKVPRPGAVETDNRPATGAELRRWMTARRGGPT